MWLDIVIVLFLAISLISGFRTGFVRGVFSLAGLVAGLWLASRYYVALAARLTFIANERSAQIAAFAIIFFAVLIIAAIIGNVFHAILQGVMLGWLNSLAGAVFSVVTGIIFAGAILSVWVKYFGGADIVSQSGLALWLIRVFQSFLAFLPGAVRSFFDSLPVKSLLVIK